MTSAKGTSHQVPKQSRGSTILSRYLLIFVYLKWWFLNLVANFDNLFKLKSNSLFDKYSFRAENFVFVFSIESEVCLLISIGIFWYMFKGALHLQTCIVTNPTVYNDFKTQSWKGWWTICHFHFRPFYLYL